MGGSGGAQIGHSNAAAMDVVAAGSRIPARRLRDPAFPCVGYSREGVGSLQERYQIVELIKPTTSDGTGHLPDEERKNIGKPILGSNHGMNSMGRDRKGRGGLQKEGEDSKWKGRTRKATREYRTATMGTP